MISKYKKLNHESSNNNITIENSVDVCELFEGCSDVHIINVPFSYKDNQTFTSTVIYCEGLCDIDLINKSILTSIEKVFMEISSINEVGKVLKAKWSKTSLKSTNKLKDITTSVFEGYLLVLLEGQDEVYLFNAIKHPVRTPEESNTEVSIKGPRDNFIEEVSTNIALVRKRLKSEDLKIKNYHIGKRSHTKVSLLYMNDIINKRLLDEISNKLEKVEIDGLFSSNQLKELLDDRKIQLFPIFEYTGRPDFVVDSLLRGRFIIMIDGTPTAIIGPANLLFLLKSPEDTEYLNLYASFERVLRIGGISIAIFFPGFWIALISFHQDQIPLSLLATLYESRRGVPMPVQVEAIIMMLVYELFREAGLRLPMAIGQILTVVGGLIIGDAAIRAGLTSPMIIVVIATSIVATYTVVNQSLVGTISIIRLLILIASSFLGLFGFFVAAFLTLLYLANLRSIGIPYLAPISPFNWKDFSKSMFRKTWRKTNLRPKMLKTDDPTRQED